MMRSADLLFPSYAARVSPDDQAELLFLAHNKDFCHHLNPLNPELNLICYLLALLAHHFSMLAG